MKIFKLKEVMINRLREPICRINPCLLTTIFLLIIFLSTPLTTFSQTNLKIGFLIRNKNDLVLQRIAEQTIEEANKEGGYKGQKFELIIKACDGPWGITSKQAVSLIYDEKVLILLTALDGRNAHLVEQVAAKSHVAMLSTLSSDPTLSRAYVPWFFRVIPDDKQQAKVLVNEIYARRGAKKVAVVVLDSYDGRKSAEAFEASAKVKSYPDPQVFYDISGPGGNDYSEMSWDAVVFAGTPEDEAGLIAITKRAPSFAFLNFFSFNNHPESFEHVWSAFPPPADYVHDGVKIAIESIKRFGPDTQAIRKGFSRMEYNGSTGRIKFDHLGNRLLD